MKAAIYARVSTVDQEPENQLLELRRYIQARGWTGSGRLPLMPDSHRHKQHPHVLKHSIATHLVLANVNLALVKMQLGRDEGSVASRGDPTRPVTSTGGHPIGATPLGGIGRRSDHPLGSC